MKSTKSGSIKEGFQTVTRHGKPAVVVISWDQYREEEEALYLSVISLGELYRGIELLPEGEKQTASFATEPC
ncbi:MAG TPA: type II toxin-antitoxin system prevent-host-death family antitoxin [Termitinemataceae bacterium]|nr:type II toxin-antitoxin system prevent-host-death family antitoxin [Termitinemataceae bacterium]HOM24455.1 type II toxin-antitoxin system prevent-host-death family antitoxin [Termitinemataceae bacterium]HPQ01556.1 type II toxin-antitoxin system prevent-host-death family antitoxin [Termitinemataceae bacterium]